jgi:hypothetical protein
MAHSHFVSPSEWCETAGGWPQPTSPSPKAGQPSYPLSYLVNPQPFPNLTVATTTGTSTPFLHGLLLKSLGPIPPGSGGRGQKDRSLKIAQSNSSQDPVSKHPTPKKKGWRSDSRCRPWVQALVLQKKKQKEKKTRLCFSLHLSLHTFHSVHAY